MLTTLVLFKEVVSRVLAVFGKRALLLAESLE